MEEDRFKSETFKLDHAGCLAPYIMDRKIGMKRSRNVRTSREAREWRGWAEKFISNSKKRMARLVRIFGKYLLEDIFGSQVTLAIMRPIRYHSLRRARLKKPSGRDRRSDNMSGLKYGI